MSAAACELVDDEHRKVMKVNLNKHLIDRRSYCESIFSSTVSYVLQRLGRDDELKACPN